MIIRKQHQNILLSLLGIEIDNHLNLAIMYQHYAKKQVSQLNAIGRLRKYIGFSEKKAFIEALVFSNFNYCPLACHFTSMTPIKKIESNVNFLSFLYLFILSDVEHLTQVLNVENLTLNEDSLV